MASNLLECHALTFKTLNSSAPSPPLKTLFLPLLSPTPKTTIPISHIPTNNHLHIPTYHFSPLCFSSSSSSSSPPASKEEAILQAKTCLSSCLLKPLNNPKLTSAKLKKVKQPRFRLEIPLLDDDSPSSLSQLAFSVFADMPISRKASKVKFLILWPDPSFAEAAATTAGGFQSDHIHHIDIASVSNSVNNRILNSADVAVFMAPSSSNLTEVKAVTERIYPKPAVMFNPRWALEEEKNLGDNSSRFVSSFEVIYAFTGLEVRGLLKRRKGAIFKCVRNGILSGERWSVLVEEVEDGGGEMKVVSQFKARPSMDEVETVLYNLMAMNSPITKSPNFLKDLASSVSWEKVIHQFQFESIRRKVL